MAITIAASGQMAAAFQPTPTFEERDFAFTAHNEYFHTEANLSPSGGRYDNLGSGRSFETNTLRISGDYQPVQQLRLGAGGELVHAKSSDPIADRDTTELNSLFIEGMYMIHFGRFLVAPQGRYLHSLRPVDLLDDSVIAGEGTNQVEVGSWLALKVGPFEPYLYGAYRSQNDGRANLMPYQLGAKYFYKNVYILAEVYGHFPISKDKYHDQPFLRWNITSNRNAGSWRFYSLDQNLLEGRAEVGFQLNPDFLIYAGGGHTIDGKNAAYGLTASVGLTYAYGASIRTSDSYEDAESGEQETDFMEDEIAKEYRKKAGKGKPKKKERFEPIRDDYDESLFTPTN